VESAETEFPGIVPIGSLVFERSEQAAIAITGMWASGSERHGSASMPS
jgi:hypothetical protein